MCVYECVCVCMCSNQQPLVWCERVHPFSPRPLATIGCILDVIFTCLCFHPSLALLRYSFHFYFGGKYDLHFTIFGWVIRNGAPGTVSGDRVVVRFCFCFLPTAGFPLPSGKPGGVRDEARGPNFPAALSACWHRISPAIVRLIYLTQSRHLIGRDGVEARVCEKKERKGQRALGLTRTMEGRQQCAGYDRAGWITIAARFAGVGLGFVAWFRCSRSRELIREHRGKRCRATQQAGPMMCQCLPPPEACVPGAAHRRTHAHC